MKVFRVHRQWNVSDGLFMLSCAVFAHSVVVRFIDLFPKLLMEGFKLCACRDGGLGFRL